MRYTKMKLKSLGCEESGSFAPTNRVRFEGKKRCSVAVVLLTLVSLLGMSAPISAEVKVDQTPLTVSEPLPPNIVLLHDDSGSMASNYLPDTAPQSGDNFRKFSKNRQYYNPETLYTRPPKADGTFYTEPNFPYGYTDPFNSTGKINIISDSDYSDGTYTTSNSYDSPTSCSDGGGTPHYHWFWGTYQSCRFYTGPFVYFDGSAKHHVVADGHSCSGLTNCHKASDALLLEVNGETITTSYGQNVANYYSYYRTRKLSAKSGIMAAFSGLDPKFRFGYGSINNSNATAELFPDDSFFNKHMSIKKVAPFGNGEPGTTKAGFWTWLNGVGSSGGTPLRRALETAGEYYKTSQPWTESGKEYACRASYTILVSDGYWSGSAPQSVYLVDSDNTGTSNYSAVDPFIGGSAKDGTATLADVANYYWKTDLRGSTANEVPETSSDPATWQHMTTFTVGLGLEVSGLGATQTELFNWARGGTPVEGWGGWPTPHRKVKLSDGSDGRSNYGRIENVSDMLHAAINGHGNFFSARDPQQFADGIKQALADIAATPGAGSSPFIGGGEKLTSETTQYAASYMTGSWAGSLKAYKYDEDAKRFSASPAWDAGPKIPEASARNIWTLNTGGTAVEFKHDDDNENLTAYLEKLGNNIYPSDQKGADWGKRVVNYLRGDKTDESTGVFRKRNTLLGDIVNSTPVVIASPPVDLYEHVLDDTYFDGLKDKKYKTFATAKATRKPMLYVAANDGMLHAFDAETGVEKFAYIPRALLSATGDGSLARLANPEYGVINPVDGSQPVPHQYYNDGKLTTQNVYLGGKWKTILVGTTGRGQSRTVYALDITDPSVLADASKAKDAILWERSAGDNSDNSDWIGMALGKPTISLIKGIDNEGIDNEGKWVVHMGNGPNSKNGKAALLQFDLADGTLSVYEAGSMDSNGLAAPYVIQSDDSDGVSEYAFAGDLQGNVWRFDLGVGDSMKSELIYVARDNSENRTRQPITGDMLATKNEKTGAIWVFFGTGRFLSKDSDVLTDSGVQTWYGLRAMKGPSGYAEVKSTHTRANLKKREIVAEDETDGGVFRATSNGEFSEVTGEKVGWYMDLISPDENKGQEGERIVYQTQLVAGRLMVNTLIPESNNPCNTSPAGSTLIVDPFSGANPGEPVLDANGDKLVNTSDITEDGIYYNAQKHEVGVSGTFTGKRDQSGNIRLFGQGIDTSTVDVGTTGGAGAGNLERLNWHEIIN